MLALIHPVVADRAPGIRRDVLERRRKGGCGVDDDRVLERTVLLERLDDGADRGALLPDRDVHALDLLRRIAASPVVALVDDRVDRDGGLAGLLVADDQLALT